MASLIAILDLKGKPLIQRSYRDDVPPSYVERFLPLILDIEEEGQQVTPCFSSQGINYMHIRHSNLYRTSCALCTFGDVSLISTSNIIRFMTMTDLGRSPRTLETKHKCG